MKDKALFMQSIFHPIAKEYDALLHLLSLGQDRLWRGFATRLLVASKEANILDLATGTGLMALELLKKLNRVEVVGVDVTPSMLSVALAKAKARGCSNRLELVAATVEQLPFREGSFGALIISLATRNVNAKGLFEETKRVLKPLGMAVSLDFSLPSGRVWRSVYLLYLRALPLIAKLFSKAWSRTLDYLASSIERVTPLAELVRLAEQLGLSLMGTYQLTGGIIQVLHLRRATTSSSFTSLKSS